MGELFDKARLTKVVKEMVRCQFPAQISGAPFNWQTTYEGQDETLVFSHPLVPGLTVVVGNIKPLPAGEGTSGGFRESYYQACVCVNLPADKAPATVTLEAGESLPSPSSDKAFKVAREAIHNQVKVNLGQSTSRQPLFVRMDMGFQGDCERLLKRLDGVLATLFWECDKPVVSSRGSARNAAF